jgi:NodT family efflux transporter outer membrane factor (OMF) lipoprotein
MNNKLRNSISSLLSLLLAGCSFSPKYVRPSIEVPQKYKETKGWKIAQPGDATVRGKWWSVFKDAALDKIEEQVGASNQTVALAAANFLSARAVVKQSLSQLFPTIGTSPSVTRSHPATGNGISVTTTQYSLPVDATWELDFWGSIRNTVKASKLETQAAQADIETARLSVQAEAAVDYFQIRSLDEQEQILNSTAAAYRESLKLTKARYETGIASDEDVAQAQTQLKTTEAQATDLGIQRAQFEHALAVLAGQPAPTFTVAHAALKTKPTEVPPGVPSELLERRPDIAAAERRVAEANAKIGVARAAFFPTITLGGSAGYESISLSHLISGPSLLWSVGATMAETLFDAGRRQGVTDQAWASYQGTVASYRQTVLTAFQEVEDNLSAMRILARELQQQDEAVKASERFLALAKDRYKLGIDSYLNVITAQAVLLNNRRTAATLRLNRTNATVLLIKALGGGWDTSKMSYH